MTVGSRVGMEIGTPTGELDPRTEIQFWCRGHETGIRRWFPNERIIGVT